jgi:hypothetical protein
MLDDTAARSGRSQSQEVEFRLERSFERQDLLQDVLTIAFGRQLGGLLLSLGITMQIAASIAGRDPRHFDDWALNVEAYSAANQAARWLLDLWQPPLRNAGDDWDAETSVRTSDNAAIAAIEGHLSLLREHMTGANPSPTPAMIIDLLGPIAAEMVEQWPRKREQLRDTQRKPAQAKRRA